VNQTVQDAIGDGGIADLLVPARERQLGSKDGGTGLVAIFADLPDFAALVFILAHASRFWLGLTCNLIMIACFIAVTTLFYELFKPVNRSVSLLAAFFSLMGCAAQTFSFLFYIAPLVVLQDAPHLGAFKAEQLRAMALMLFKLYVKASNIGSAFFGFYCLLIGYLVFRSAFLPRILGVLMMFAGVSWLTFLYPPLANSLRPYNLAPGILGEGSLTLWLLTMGVNVERWKEQTGPHGTQ
jgi:hypothetical protein